jgi:hypothetical protein
MHKYNFTHLYCYRILIQIPADARLSGGAIIKFSVNRLFRYSVNVAGVRAQVANYPLELYDTANAFQLLGLQVSQKNVIFDNHLMSTDTMLHCSSGALYNVALSRCLSYKYIAVMFDLTPADFSFPAAIRECHKNVLLIQQKEPEAFGRFSNDDSFLPRINDNISYIAATIPHQLLLQQDFELANEGNFNKA